MEGGLRSALDEISNLVAGSDRDGALDHDCLGDLVFAKRVDHLGNVAGDSQDVLQIRRTVRIARRADADEDDVSVRVGGGLVRGELKPSGVRISLDHLGETRLVDRALASFEHGDFPLVYVETYHIVSGLSEAGSGD